MAARKKSKKANEVAGVEYVAGKHLKLSRDGETVKVMPGEPTPEAAGFRNLANYLKSGAVIGLVDGEPIRESLRHIGRIRNTPQWLHFTDKKARGTQAAANRKASAARAGGRKSEAEAPRGAAAEGSKTAGTPAKKTAKKKTTKKATKSKGKKKTGRRRREA